MGIVKTWVYTIGAIVVIILSWYLITPIYQLLKDSLDTTIFDGVTGIAKDVYNTTHYYTGNILNVSVVIFILVILIWAYLRSQSKERYTGRYQR